MKCSCVVKWYRKSICCFKVLLRGRQDGAKAMLMMRPFSGQEHATQLPMEVHSGFERYKVSTKSRDISGSLWTFLLSGSDCAFRWLYFYPVCSRRRKSDIHAIANSMPMSHHECLPLSPATKTTYDIIL